eukprot:2623065-Rhodomonas_salina.2
MEVLQGCFVMFICTSTWNEDALTITRFPPRPPSHGQEKTFFKARHPKVVGFKAVPVTHALSRPAC